ncbi:hypothetical protein D770_20485 [Flammeovirgaceae bacterium 311]|nr:hypothetical protein D770_20485 [Flammeovirgaceae bacterium 311]
MKKENEQGNEKLEDLLPGSSPAKETKKRVEISKEAEQERLYLSDLLIQRTENFAEEARLRKKKREEETIELHSGVKISISQINELLTAQRQPYSPKFPNSSAFFSEIYRLNAWKDLNPNDYIKPPIVAVWINEIIYGRFTKEVLRALQVLNPASPIGLRLYKHFQFLNEEGQARVIQYRDEAIALMKTCSTWYEFRIKLHTEYGVAYQIKMFEEKS